MLGTDQSTISELLESLKPPGTQYIVLPLNLGEAYGPFDTYDEAFEWSLNTPNMGNAPIPLYPRGGEYLTNSI